jgi:arylsulfatase A-like enzyme
MVTWMDAGVGAILNKLDQMGVTENTLVIFLADQQNIGKSTPYECGANIPFIARWPKVIPAQSENHSLLDVTDMAATVIDLAGATPDKELDGMSLRPLWKNQVQQLKPYIFTEMGQTKAVIGQDYKYIAFRYEPKLLKRGYVPPEGGSIAKLAKQGAFKGLRNNSPFGQAKRIGIADPDQLYHLGKDPKEKNNLAHQPEQKEQLERMKRELSHYIQDLGRHFGEFLN